MPSFGASLGRLNVVAPLVVVVCIFMCLLVPQASALSPEALIYITNSLGNVSIPCDTVTNATNCSLTAGCTWNATNLTATVNGTCTAQRRLPTINGTGILNVPDSWCYEYFPEWFIGIVYFLACLSTGFACAGVAYNYTYYDVYVTMLDGERLYNRFYFKTSYMNVYLAILVACSIALFGTAAAYFQDAFNCAYIPMTYVFLVVCVGIPLVAGVAYGIWLFLEYLNKRELHVNLDEYIKPTTAQALPRLNNQVRCF